VEEMLLSQEDASRSYRSTRQTSREIGVLRSLVSRITHKDLAYQHKRSAVTYFIWDDGWLVGYAFPWQKSHVHAGSNATSQDNAITMF